MNKMRAWKSTQETIQTPLLHAKLNICFSLLIFIPRFSITELRKTPWHYIQGAGQFDPVVLETAWLIAN